MTNKQIFIAEIEKLIAYVTDLQESDKEILSPDAQLFLDQLKTGNGFGNEITESGLKILSWCKENCKKYNNLFTAKVIAEGLFMTPRSVSGSMRKLISDEYFSKTGTNPVSYSLNEKGINYKL
jgi:hypothetical protein